MSLKYDPNLITKEAPPTSTPLGIASISRDSATYNKGILII